MQKIVISDTNILIDLLDIGLADKYSPFPWNVQASDMVLHRLQNKQRESLMACIASHRLTLHKMEDEELLTVVRKKNNHKQGTSISLADWSAWHYAHEGHHPLLTDDRILRQLAEKDGIEVLGKKEIEARIKIWKTQL